MTVAIAEDSVAIRRIIARNVGEAVLRRQFAALPTPRVKKFVFVRRLKLRAPAERLGATLQTALEQLAGAAGDETVAYNDFAAMAVACAEAALAGSLGAWHWRRLGIPTQAGPGAAVATLLADHPLEAGAAVAALAVRGLLAQVWSDLGDGDAERLIAALSHAAALPAPDWPQDDEALEAGAMEAAKAREDSELLRRASAFWAPVLAAKPARSPARRAAAFLALLRWAPDLLRGAPSRSARALLMAFAEPPAAPPPPGRVEDVPARVPPPAAAPEPTPSRDEPTSNSPPPTEVAASEKTAARAPHYEIGKAASRPDLPAQHIHSEASPSAGGESEAHGEALVTNWGGVFFLINALRRIDIEARLDALGEDAPSGWRLLKELGHAFGLPGKEPLTYFLEEQDCDTRISAETLAALAVGLERLYAAQGPWPPPLRQLARLRFDETHIDLDLYTMEVDIELRLAGLDLNPGWTPWLGRVVTFLYPNLRIFSGGDL